MKVCPFCAPQPGEIFYEGSLIQGLWNSHPLTPGHALLATRRHVADWFAASPAEQKALMDALALGRDAVLAAGHLPQGFNVGMDLGELAGQAVPHLHVHLVPRYPGDFQPGSGPTRPLGNWMRQPEAIADGHKVPGGVQPTLSSRLIPKRLVTGDGDPLLQHLQQNLDSGLKADIAVAFVTMAGLQRVLPRLSELLDRQGTVRFLTGDQEQFNHPSALRRLLDLGTDDRCQIRIFQCDTLHRFHPKFYLFENQVGDVNAFVGSSNLTDQALRSGVEWNYRVSSPDASVAQLRQEFNKLFHHPNTRVLNEAWITAYEARRPADSVGLPGGASLAAERTAPTDEELPPPPDPHPIQQEALRELQRTRAEGYQAGLVVLATGLGKTWLAAFDSQSFSRVLFVAHREEILTQARDTFRRIRPSHTFGLYNGQEKAPEAQTIFASIQTLSRVDHLRKFAPDAFDYIIVDEFHHASAASYRRLLDYFRCRFLLGLTATPERTDGGNLLSLCEENLVYRCDFWDGIRRERLCPFHYFGVPDVVDYRNIPWRNKAFDPEALEHALITEARALNALEQYRQRGGRRTLAFCCSMRHADYMAEFLQLHDVRAVAVHSGAHSAPRAASLEQLRDGELDVVCCVDMFSEGVDLPGVDTIMMLRPTESRILWLQQMGRGLRRDEGKTHVTIIDYIGNHRTFLIKPLTLLGAASSADLKQKLELAMAQELVLPPGCSVTYDLEAIDLIRGLLRLAPVDALETYYQEFSELHGVRPSARETYHDFRSPRSAIKGYGSWLGFVAAQPTGLTDPQRRAFESQKIFLKSLETTQMTRSYKMLVLEALLARDALPGALPVEELASEVARLALRSPRLAEEFGKHLSNPKSLVRYLEENPIAAWTGGKGTGGESYFYYRDGEFGSLFSVAERDAFQELVRELVEWRLAEYLDRPGASTFEIRVSHTDGKPILRLPDRDSSPGYPEGWTTIRCDDSTYEANFVKVAVNVLRVPGSEENVLPRVLRGWFGPDAGLPGTAFRVRLESDSDGWRLSPMGVSAGQLTLWKRYSREQIPAFFGLKFNTGLWNTGFVIQKPHIFLLITLDKKGQQETHQYQDHFLSSQRFAWQSQNRTTQNSSAGQALRSPQSTIHLFVRPSKREAFFYCGPVEFIDWDGEQPINVTWQLRNPVPSVLHESLGIPTPSK